MAPEDKNSKLEELQESLYDSTQAPKGNVRRLIHEREFDVPELWNGNKEEIISNEIPPEERVSHSKKIPLLVLIVSLILCISAAVFAWYRLSGESATVSQNLIALESQAPVFIDGGEEFDYVVSLSNQNTTQLELVDLEVSYPQGVEDVATSRIVTIKDVGTVLPNTVIQEKFPLTLYGIPGTTKPITTTLRYSVPGSTATFEKKETKVVEIKSSPLTLTVESLKEVTPGQTMKVKVRVESTRGKTIQSSLLKLTYPTGFEFVSADVAPTSGNNVWDLGILTPGVVREITVSGIARGEDGESRAIRAQIGSKDASGIVIASLFAESSLSYILTKPFLQTDILVSNVKAAVHTVSSGSDITVVVAYKNNVDKNLQNAEIALTLNGDAIMEETVRVEDGFYDSRTNTVTWTRSAVRELANLEPDATGKVSVVFKTKGSASLDTNEEIKIDVSAKARRVGEIELAETVVSSQSTLLRVVTRVALVAESARSGGSFSVFGPVPPRGEQETSYVLISQIKNTVNPIDRAEVKFKLPFNVRFIEGVATQGSVTYSEFDKQVRWNAGSVVKSSSGTDPVLYVHVAVTPSLVDVGRSPSLATDFTLTATDIFTKTPLSAKGPSVITTKFRVSDGFKKGDDLVTQ